MTELRCRICFQRGSFPLLSARERMFGTYQAFDYFRCGHCGCLQIKDIPETLSDYYPPDYYAYRQERGEGLRARLRRWRNRGLLQHRPVGWALNILRPFEALQGLALRELALWRQARILDVGCGQGQVVLALAELGYEQVYGIDPFLPASLEQKTALLSRQELAWLKPGWDLIMLHHSLEHMPDPHDVLKQAHRLLKARGWLLLRVPTVDSWAFTHYGPFWVQWDPPRHLYLLARENLPRLARQHGFTLRLLRDDAGSFSIWASEAYRRGMLLSEARARPVQKICQRLQTEALNRHNRGDQIICLMQKA